MERVKVLTAALALRQFTVDQVASLSGVNRNTVRSVLDRSVGIVERLGAEAPVGPGRPAARWSVKDSAETRTFIASIQALTTLPVVTSAASHDDQRAAAVSGAEDALTKIAGRDPARQQRILKSARATLNLIGGDDLQSAAAAHRWWLDDESDVAIRARAIEAIAALAASSEDEVEDDALSDIVRQVAAAMKVTPERAEATYLVPFVQIVADKRKLPARLVVREISAALASANQMRLSGGPVASPPPGRDQQTSNSLHSADPSPARGGYMDVLLTGGDTEMGRVVAQSFRDSGHRVIIAGARRDELQIAAKELDVDYLVVDNTDPASLAAVRYAFRGGLGAIVNIPEPAWIDGDPRTHSLVDRAAAWRAALDSTVLSAVLTVQILGDQLKSSGSIINIAPGNAAEGSADAAIKAALSAWTAGQADYFGGRGITINTIAGGSYTSDQSTMYGRGFLESQVHEIARLAMFLTTQSARHITGETLHVGRGALTGFA